MDMETTYIVVKNHEDQYSIWELGKDIPDGWESNGFQGSKADCLNHIEEIWTDLKPHSIRDKME